MAGLLSLHPAPREAADDAVAATLRQWAVQPFVWGTSDCFLSVLAYAEAVTGRRMQRRPHYSSALAAGRILRAAGGFEPYCRKVFAQLRCAPTDAPVRGDIGLIDLPDVGLTMCLSLGTFWAARGDREVVVGRARATVAWAVNNGSTVCPKP